MRIETCVFLTPCCRLVEAQLSKVHRFIVSCGCTEYILCISNYFFIYEQNMCAMKLVLVQ